MCYVGGAHLTHSHISLNGFCQKGGDKKFHGNPYEHMFWIVFVCVRICSILTRIFFFSINCTFVCVGMCVCVPVFVSRWEEFMLIQVACKTEWNDEKLQNVDTHSNDDITSLSSHYVHSLATNLYSRTKTTYTYSFHLFFFSHCVVWHWQRIFFCCCCFFPFIFSVDFSLEKIFTNSKEIEIEIESQLNDIRVHFSLVVISDFIFANVCFIQYCVA